MIDGQLLGRETPEQDVAELIETVKGAPEHRDVLVELLSERNPVYAGRSGNATIRMRGYAMAAFEQVGLPETAVLYVLEELESGRDPYLVAAAAKAVRGLDTASGEIVPFLLKGIENVKYVDDAVTFEAYGPRWPLSGHTTALDEIFRTFAWLGPQARSALPSLEGMQRDGETFSPAIRQAIGDAIRAIGTHTDEAHCEHDHAEDGHLSDSCCEGPVTLALGDHVGPARRMDAPVPTGVELEDQDGESLTYGDFFSGRPSLVAFFYTRCTNPNKCSLTITKLARLQRAIADGGRRDRLRVAAITYDPGFDLTPRMRAYGENRGFVFDRDNRFLRAPAGVAGLDDYFELGVNFGPAVVNRHRIELFILDTSGSIAATFARLQWDVDAVLDCARTVSEGPRGRGALKLRGARLTRTHPDKR